MTDKSILIVDDNLALCDNLEDILKENGYEPRSANSCADGLKLAAGFRPQVVLLDLKLPDGLGSELMAKLIDMDPDCICIISTAFADVESAIRALELGAFLYLHKPVRPAELIRALERAFEMIELRNDKRIGMEKLRESEKKFRMLFEHSTDPNLLIKGNTFVDCNQATLNILRAGSKQEILNMHPYELSPEYQPDGRLSIEKADEMIAIALQNGSHRFEWMHRRINGETFPAEVSLTLIQESGDSMIFTVWRDISERKQQEDSLKTSEEKFRSLVENSIDVIFVLDANGVFQFVSPAWEKHFGYPVNEVLNQPFVPFVHPDDVTPCFEYMKKVVASGEALTSPVYRVRHRDGHWCSFIANGSIYQDPSGASLYLGVGRDISEQLRSEEERLKLEHKLLHAQKLESLGVLAGGIAHDFNNILMAIMGNADLALMRINKESPAVENLRRIEKAAAQAADLAKQMLAYSGRGKFVIESLDLNRLLEDMLHMLEVSISKKAVLRFNLHQALPHVEADATQMRQIIMNLVINASEAIGDKSGVIAITTGCMDCDQSYLKNVWLDENICEGLYVYLEVADTGCGMDKEILARIFDPFFTTKFTGRGLGMAAVLGIIRGHKGAIKVYSEPGKGSSFKILLPASDRPPELFNHNGDTNEWQGSGTILLVDDEETVRAIGAEMLKELGFTVITADDGKEAIEKFKSTPDIVLVILDLTMPHMDGEQCFRELRWIKPDIKVIISSGYNEQEITQRFVGKGLAGFIQKPYTLSMLRDVIRGILQ